MTIIDSRTATASGADNVLTVDDLCEHLVVSKDHVADEVRQSRRHASQNAWQLRFRKADVIALVKANGVTGIETEL